MIAKNAPQRLPADFYLRTDVVAVARDLLGKILVTEFEGRHCAVRITEVEAYRAPDDRASHAWANRRTARTETMFRAGGRAYVYLCYGIHHLFNVVTAPEGMAHAVLLRAAEPLEGLDYMLERRKLNAPSPKLSTGPGALAQALGLRTAHDGLSLIRQDSPVWMEDRGYRVFDPDIGAGPRIGVEYAGECAAWEWRFWLKGSKFVKG